MASVLTYPCALCFAPSQRWCTRCRAVWYCCSDHLATDWARHKRECYQAPGGYSCATTPPPLQMRPVDVAAIAFIPGEERARTLVVSCQSAAASPGAAACTDGSGCPDPLLHGFFPHGAPQSVLVTQGLNNETLRYPLQLWYCPASMASQKSPNKAVHGLAAGKASRPWFGPVVVLKHSGSRRQGYTDASFSDLTALSAYFLAYK